MYLFEHYIFLIGKLLGPWGLLGLISFYTEVWVWFLLFGLDHLDYGQLIIHSEHHFLAKILLVLLQNAC